MHATDQINAGSLLAIIIGLIIVTVVSYLLFRKRKS
jgi:LPXTG-motif cell wall-anchored protein